MKGEHKLIPLELVNDSNRAREDLGAIGELANSIQTYGLMQPIVVMQPNNGDSRYILVAGGRRTQAHRFLRCSEIEALIFPYTEDPIMLKEMELEENIRRKDLSWQEKLKLEKEIDDLKKATFGEKISRNPDDPAWSTSKTAEYLGVDKATLSRDFDLLKAMKTNPELASCKSKHEAMKTMEKAARKSALAAVVKILDTHQSKSPLNDIRNKIISSYVIGDFNAMSASIDSGSVDIVEFDPPYCIEPMAYAIDTTEQQQKDLFTPTNANDTDMQDSYMSFLETSISNIHRILKPDSWFICWTSFDWAFHIKQMLLYHGFKLHITPCFWTKPGSGVTSSPEYNLGSSTEMFWLARKGNAKIRRMGRSNTFIYSDIAGQKKVHPTERPIEMIQEVIDTLALPGQMLVCPCLGSGNTILACQNLKISALGFDISDTYLDSYKLKVNTNLPGGYRSY